MRKHLVILALCSILLVHCTSQATLPPIPLVTVAPIESTSTILNAETVSPTPMLVPTIEKTATLIPEVMSTADVHGNGNFPGVENHCLDVSNSLSPSASKPTGAIVLAKEGSEEKDSYLLDLKTDTKISLENLEKQEIGFFAVSPDRQRLAYIVSNRYLMDETIVIAADDGKIKKTYNLGPFSGGGGGIQQWLDNERLWIVYGEGIAPDAYSLMLNPFTGEQKEFRSDYPKLYDVNPPWFWGDYNQVRAIYNPALTRVIYPSYEPRTQIKIDNSTIHLNSIVLWDLQNYKMVANFFEYPGQIGTQPVWSPDGSKFVIDFETSFVNPSSGEVGRNIYIVNQDGQVEQQTSIKYPEYYKFLNYAWSPDGKAISFWLKVGEIRETANTRYDLYQLAIWDVRTNQVTNYCIPAYMNRTTYPKYAPIWSPDGTYLAIAASLNFDPQNPKETTVIVNPFDGWAYQIADDVAPVGWMLVGQ